MFSISVVFPVKETGGAGRLTTTEREAFDARNILKVRGSSILIPGIYIFLIASKNVPKKNDIWDIKSFIVRIQLGDNLDLYDFMFVQSRTECSKELLKHSPVSLLFNKTLQGPTFMQQQ